MRLSLGYPDKINEVEILKSHSEIKSMDLVKPIMDGVELVRLQEQVDKIKVHDDIYRYIVNISGATRVYEDIRLGASPRASIDLLRASKAKALVAGRDYVIPDDVKSMTIPVLSHRLSITGEARIERKRIEDILKGVLNRVTVPVISNE